MDQEKETSYNKVLSITKNDRIHDSLVLIFSVFDDWVFTTNPPEGGDRWYQHHHDAEIVLMRFEGGGKRCVELNGPYLVGHVITFLNHDHDVSNNDSSIGGSNNNNSYEHEQMPTVETAVTNMQYNPRSIHSCFLDAASEGLTFDKMQPRLRN